MQMSNRNFVKQAQEVVGQQKINIAMKLAKGSCPSMEAYNREVGRMEGLDIAIGLMKDMLSQLEDMENEKDSQLGDMTGTG